MESEKIRVIIPALNEAASIQKVLRDLPPVAEALVVDNGSSDATSRLAREAGATVLFEPRRGYGAACLKGIGALPPDTGIAVFLDGDYSDDPRELESLVAPIRRGEADLVIGSRVLGRRERGALLPAARFGNWLAVGLIRRFWQYRYTDLGPFRAIRFAALQRLDMRDRDFGWTVEMQIKALKARLRVREVPVSYRRRIGHSKISGTVTGSLRAGRKILWTIFRERLR